MSYTRGAASSSFENLSPVSQAVNSSRPRRSVSYREASDSELSEDDKLEKSSAIARSRCPKRNISDVSEDFSTPIPPERSKKLRSSSGSLCADFSPGQETFSSGIKRLRRSSRHRVNAAMIASKADINTTNVKESDDDSANHNDEKDEGKVYSFRDRSRTKRETLNVRNLGGDGDGYRRSTNSFVRRSDRLAYSTEKVAQQVVRDYCYKQRLPSGGKIPNPAYYRDLKQHRNNRYDKLKGDEVSRRHFDSSSESSDSDSKRPHRLNACYEGSYGQVGNEDQHFHNHERRRLNDELNSIQPLNMSGSGAGCGMGGSILDKHSQRDLSRADVLPVAIDGSVGFDAIGGLDHHIMHLKEMVVLPLMYPEVFTHFATQPPRGVLFVGPPGTGKTLTARALANSFVQDNVSILNSSGNSKKVSFFMRKGADCLSKWVGEGERQLRLLFEQVRYASLVVKNYVYDPHFWL